MLSRYKDVFGAPGTGVHAARFLGLARNDLLMTAVASWPLSSYMQWPLWKAFAALFGAGVGFHLLFGVQTPITAAISAS